MSLSVLSLSGAEIDIQLARARPNFSGIFAATVTSTRIQRHVEYLEELRMRPFHAAVSDLSKTSFVRAWGPARSAARVERRRNALRRAAREHAESESRRSPPSFSSITFGAGALPPTQGGWQSGGSGPAVLGPAYQDASTCRRSARHRRQRMRQRFRKYHRPLVGRTFHLKGARLNPPPRYAYFEYEHRLYVALRLMQIEERLRRLQDRRLARHLRALDHELYQRSQLSD
ncbi:hypothetical protein C8R43DRAFT_1122723 [Mycena crocata]|nr:hypothetical protein C8R43DRAFT_1122723 [Mycena crocata]